MRIFDTLLFDNELDILEHRLRETFDLVDRFVIVEAAETFRGCPKPLNYSANRARFAWASTKILPVVVDRLGGPATSPWVRQEVQRNAIMLGLRDAAPDDIVMILDVDEVPSRSLLERLRASSLDRPHRLAMTRHYEFVDRLGPGSACCPLSDSPFPFHRSRVSAGAWNRLDKSWYGRSGVAVRFCDLTGDPERALPSCSPFDMRSTLARSPILEDAGRHLIAVDHGATLDGKLGRVSHAELGDVRARSQEFLSRARALGVHHHGWWYAEVPAGSLPDDLSRLIERVPQLRAAGPSQTSIWRQLFRTWSWLRYWPVLPARLVFTIDKNFAVLLPLLLPLLLVAGCLRRLGAHFHWSWLRALSTEAGHHGPH